MKKYLLFIFFSLLLIVAFLYRKDLVKFYVDNFIKIDKNVTITTTNDYYRDYDFLYVKNIKELKPKNKQDILNIYYSVINSGNSNIAFYCPSEYTNCLNDVKDIANDQVGLSNLNNYVHPFNSFKHIETEYDSLGKVKIIIQRTYTDEQIKVINNKVDEIIKEIIKSSDDNETKIKLIHDYIINNSKYDSKRSDEQIATYHSDIAYGNLIEGYGLCGGYTDSMAIFLNRLGIKNYKLSSENHIWNAVYLNNNWYHLDLTWDDPITDSGTDILEYNFFLIDDEELQELNTNQHNYDKTFFKEFAN